MHPIPASRAADGAAPPPQQVLPTMTNLERAVALRAAGELAEAVAAFRLAIKEDPLNPEVWYQTAMAAMDSRDYRFATAMLESYVRFERSRPGPFFDLAFCQMRIGDYAAAVRSLDRSLALRPEHPRGLVALGQMLYALGRADEGFAAHSRALAVHSDAPSDRAVCGIIRMLRGDYARGWADFEARFDSRSFHGVPTWPAGARTWSGAADRMQTVYVHAEGGYGDTIMFARYFARVAERAGRVVLVVQPALERLLATIPGVSEFAENALDAPADAHHVSTWSLPHVFGSTIATAGIEVPYLHVGPDPLPRAEGAPLRVGISWAGNRVTTHDLDRSCPSLAVLAPLFAVPGVEWTSLQYGEGAEAAGDFPVAACPIIGDFVDTARLLATLDLVISVDTAVAHLAGAMGVPTWLMPPAMPEFRWLLERDTSPWYPHHRLFRRADTHDWPGVAGRVAAALAERAGAAVVG